MVVKRKTSGNSLKNANLDWVNLRITRLCLRYGGEWWKKAWRKSLEKKLSLGWFNLRILKLCFGYGGEWWWAGQTQENHWLKNYFGLVQSNDHQALFWIWWWLVVRREPQENYWKRLFWVGSTLESHGFVLDMVVNGDWKNLKKIIGKNYFGVVQFKNPKALFWIWWWMVVKRKTSGKSLAKTTYGWGQFKNHKALF